MTRHPPPSAVRPSAAVDRGGLARARVRAALRQVLGEAADALGDDAVLLEHGVDSLRGVQVCAALSAMSGRTVPLSMIWRRPTIAALAAHLAVLYRNVGDFRFERVALPAVDARFFAP